MIITYTVRCDWPGCDVRETVSHYSGSPRDHRWAARAHGTLDTDHLCPAHRFRTWAELDADRTAYFGDGPYPAASVDHRRIPADDC